MKIFQIEQLYIPTLGYPLRGMYPSNVDGFGRPEPPDQIAGPTYAYSSGLIGVELVSFCLSRKISRQKSLRKRVYEKKFIGAQVAVAKVKWFISALDLVSASLTLRSPLQVLAAVMLHVRLPRY
jgi:hypothetical protein